MPSPFPCSPMLRKWLWKKTQIEKKNFLRNGSWVDNKWTVNFSKFQKWTYYLVAALALLFTLIQWHFFKSVFTETYFDSHWDLFRISKFVYIYLYSYSQNRKLKESKYGIPWYRAYQGDMVTVRTELTCFVSEKLVCALRMRVIAATFTEVLYHQKEGILLHFRSRSGTVETTLSSFSC